MKIIVQFNSYNKKGLLQQCVAHMQNLGFTLTRGFFKPEQQHDMPNTETELLSREIPTNLVIFAQVQ